MKHLKMSKTEKTMSPYTTGREHFTNHALVAIFEGESGRESKSSCECDASTEDTSTKSGESGSESKSSVRAKES
ncbi:hypothetical protein PPTG_22130 [Phytophthora nicotianae INRA-310]|uniref:Uncharacterized protein n=1 Tax=Phytophthora nicotianae (strain INRA-310) TaxID=761204 RepID=W2QMZ6_PHYN3|nr:hypothetical protein PPTG_22130 [Phytophthora nicotianae INRA-310]ETN14508.1 hypothetical protein PPTG_22130 [Phytophthora nicotianae INRA-310]